MSRNKNVDYTQYIHPFVDENGVQRFAVAEFDEITRGFNFYFSKKDSKLIGVPYRHYMHVDAYGGYLTRKQALRRAMYLFGGK